MVESTPAYFLFHQDQVQGPLSLDQVQRLLAKGAIGPDTLCAIENAEQWLPVEHVLATTQAPAAAAAQLEDAEAQPIAYVAAASVFFGVAGVLCLGVVALHRHWGFSLLAAATILAIGFGALTLMRGRTRSRCRYDNGLAVGGIAAGGLALLTGSFLVFAVNAQEPDASSTEGAPTPAAVQKNGATQPQQPAAQPAAQAPEIQEPPAAGVVDITAPAFPAPSLPARAIATP